MNTQIQTRTEAQITELKFSEQAPIYNEFAAALGIKQLKKFRDKSTGVSRIMQIQEQYVEERDEILAEQKAKAAKAVKKVEKSVAKDTKRQTRFDMDTIVELTDLCDPKEGTIEFSIRKAIISYSCNPDENPEWEGVTAGDIVSHVITKHKRPRSGLGVDEQYVVHNIKWFVKKGHLKLV